MRREITQEEIAARAGVSRGTVSLALRNSPKISAKTTAQILKVAKKLGYRPNLNASRLARADYSTIGVLISDLHNPIMADILDGFVLLEPDGEHDDTHLASGFNSVEREREAIDSFLSHRVKGVVLMGSLLEDSEIQELAGILPTVAIGRRVEGVDCVLVNDEEGGRLVADHLIGLGHRALAHIDGGKGAGAVLRKSAFLKTARTIEGAQVVACSGNYTQKSGYDGARKLWGNENRPTAIFAANDLMALGVLGAAHERGLVAGRDFALVGFDDITHANYVSLTTVSYSRPQMGLTARRLLQRRCTDQGALPETVQLQPTLVARGTSNPPLEISRHSL